jgi:serine/threonine protein kinase
VPRKTKWSLVKTTDVTISAGGSRTTEETTQFDVFGLSSSSAAPSAPRDAFDGVRIQRVAWSELVFDVDSDGQPQVLGMGGNGQVTKAKWGSTDVAIKELHLNVSEDASEAENAAAESSFFAEAVAAWDLVHPRINAVLAVAVDKHESGQTHYGLVMQYALGGSLRSVLSDRESIRIPVLQRVKWICQIAEGVDYMHRNGKVHGDLKAANVLLDSNGDASLCDFGFASVHRLKHADAVSAKHAAVTPQLAAIVDGRYARSALCCTAPLSSSTIPSWMVLLLPTLALMCMPSPSPLTRS